MGPLFSLALVLIAALVLCLSAFVFARHFRFPQPHLVALAFSGGAVLGAAASVLIGALVIGVGSTLNSALQIVCYLALVGLGALSAGAFAVWCCMRFLTINSTGRAARAG